jgi:hypothetical protein
MGAMSWRATSSPLLTPGPASATGGEVLRLEATEGRHIVTGWPPKPRHLGTNPVAHIEKHFDHIRSAPTPHQLHSNFAERWDSIVAGGVPPLPDPVAGPHQPRCAEDRERSWPRRARTLRSEVLQAGLQRFRGAG